MSRVSLVAMLVLCSCAYISDDDEKWRLDPDGDGVPVDDDCDSDDADAGELVTYWSDLDGDGFGDPATEATACRLPDGGVLQSGDCDDSDPAVNPQAPDEWYDGIDSDCGGEDDFDQDGDGFGVDTDCDDEDASRFPQADTEEVFYNGVDDNCDASDSDGDQDGDGFWAEDYINRVAAAGAVPLPVPEGARGDCWDDPADAPADQQVFAGAAELSASDVYPGAAEVWYDGADQDCSGGDANDDGVLDDIDQDLDGYASADHPDGAGVVGADCDDLDAEIHPDQVEVWYDGVDQDCSGDDVCGGAPDGVSDDYDADCDGDRPVAEGGGDCDDFDDERSSLMAEVWYDGVDQDCSGNGGVDDYDQDGDGQTSYEMFGGDDCDDFDSAAYTGAASAEPSLCTEDLDGDGYGAASAASPLDPGTDCDDGDSTLNPADSDSDGVSSCDGDCDDGDASIYPWAGDTYGDGTDGDCDGLDCEATWSGGEYLAVCPDEITSYNAGVSFCQAAGYMGLAMPQSGALQASLEDLFSASGASSSGATSAAWIGMRGAAYWSYWDDGTSVRYDNWWTSPAFNTSLCAAALLSSGEWVPVDCSDSRMVTCGL